MKTSVTPNYLKISIRFCHLTTVGVEVDRLLESGDRLLPTVRTILNRQRWNAGFSIITEANTNDGMLVSASVSKNVRSIVITAE